MDDDIIGSKADTAEEPVLDLALRDNCINVTWDDGSFRQFDTDDIIAFTEAQFRLFWLAMTVDDVALIDCLKPEPEA